MKKVLGKLLLPTGLALSLSLVVACRDNDSKKASAPVDSPKKSQDLTLDGTQLGKMIGVLRAGDASCTAFISGEKELTTAYHCLEKSPGTFFDLSELEFTLADGSKPSLSAITMLAPRKDLARLQLKEKAEFHLETSVKTQDNFTLVAYDLDSDRLHVNAACKWNTDITPAGVFAYECDTKGHYSGAPLFEGNKVIGIHLGYKPKVDRRVALDFATLENEQTDILEVEYLKEGCHIRGELGLLTHTRAHVRGCDPISMIEEITQGRKDEAKNEYDAVSVHIQEIKENTSAQMDLLKRSADAYGRFIPCIDDAKAKKDAIKADNCFKTFKDEMNVIVGELSRYLTLENQAKWDLLKADARKFVNETHRISQDIVNHWNGYISCTESALAHEQPIQKSAALKGCNTTMILQFRTISNDIRALDVNILDTF